MLGLGLIAPMLLPPRSAWWAGRGLLGRGLPLPPPQRLDHPLEPALVGQGAPVGVDLSAFEVPEGMVVSSITLSPAVEREVEEEESASEEARRSGRYARGR